MVVFKNLTSLLGAGRYVPGSASNAAPPVGGVDPFTGKRQCPPVKSIPDLFVCFSDMNSALMQIHALLKID